MGNGALLAGALALGAAGGFAASMLATTSSSTSRPADSGVVVDRSDLERLERRVNELSAAVNAPALAPASPVPFAAPAREEGGAAPSGGGGGPASSPDRLEALEKRVAAIEARGPGGAPLPADLSKLPVAQLEALVRNLTAEKRNGDAVTVAEELLRRSDLTPEQRVDVEMNLGYALRNQGKHGEAEARFRETLARVGDDSEKAPLLEFQLGWERSYQRDLPGAVAEMERAANHRRVQPIVRAHALYAAANFARESGDTARAQVLLERFLQQTDALPPSQVGMKAQAEAWLKEIRGS
jgi:hypothetical protein